jgi:hypothetical protein
MNPHSHAKGFCFPRNHQTPGESALHNYMTGASRKSGIFYSDDRRDAKQFKSQKSGGGKVSKNTVAVWRHSLERKGWIERIDGGPRQRNPSTGMWASIRYRVLTHAQWLAKYPGRCDGPIQSEELPRSDGDNMDDRTQPLGQAPDPTIGSGPDPINPQYRTQPLGHKEKLKRKEGEAEIENATLTSSKPDGRTKTLTDLVIQTAISTSDGEASTSFTKTAKAEIARVIQGMAPTEAELIAVTTKIVARMDAFALQTAGSRIAASLAGYLAARTEAMNQKYVASGPSLPV